VIQVILEGLMLGLSTGVYCVGVCLVFFMPYLLVEGKHKVFENSRKILLFMSGRLIAYIGFALIIGFIGANHRDILTARFSHFSLVMASLLMLTYALTNNFPDHKFCKSFLQRFSVMRVPFFLGLFSGLNPCAPFLVGVTRLLTLEGILNGVILFVAFFLGTSVYMVPLVFVSYLNRIERVKQIGSIVALLSGVWFLFVGLTGLMR